MVYSFLDYFKKYGSTMRTLSGQIETNYDIIKKTSDEATDRVVKGILEDVLAINELL